MIETTIGDAKIIFLLSLSSNLAPNQLPIIDATPYRSNTILRLVPTIWVNTFKNSEMYEYPVYIPAFKNITPNTDIKNTPVLAADIWDRYESSFQGILGKNSIVSINTIKLIAVNNNIAYW